MTFDAPTNAGKTFLQKLHVLIVSDTQKNSVFWLVQMMLYDTMLPNFPPFSEANVISHGPRNGLSMQKMHIDQIRFFIPLFAIYATAMA